MRASLHVQRLTTVSRGIYALPPHVCAGYARCDVYKHIICLHRAARMRPHLPRSLPTPARPPQQPLRSHCFFYFGTRTEELLWLYDLRVYPDVAECGGCALYRTLKLSFENKRCISVPSPYHAVPSTVNVRYCGVVYRISS